MKKIIALVIIVILIIMLPIIWKYPEWKFKQTFYDAGYYDGGAFIELRDPNSTEDFPYSLSVGEWSRANNFTISFLTNSNVNMYLMHIDGVNTYSVSIDTYQCPTDNTYTKLDKNSDSYTEACMDFQSKLDKNIEQIESGKEILISELSKIDNDEIIASIATID